MTIPLQRLALGALVGLMGVGHVSAADGVETRTSGGSFYKRVVTNTNPQTTSTLAFQDLPGAGTTVFVPPQTTVLISAGFDAEARCSNGTDPAPDWCEAQILIGGVEGAPQASTFAPDTFSFKSTNAGADGTSSWAGHAFSRHHCVRNTTSAPMAVNVRVQWKVTNFGGAAVPEFWIDDSSLVVEMSRDCTVTSNPNPTGTAPTSDAHRTGADPQHNQE